MSATPFFYKPHPIGKFSLTGSNSNVFEMVDGASNQAITVDVALGRDPEYPSQKVEFSRAAKFFWRLFEGDGIVKTVPSEEEIAQVQKEMPNTVFLPQVPPACDFRSFSSRTATAMPSAISYIGGEDRKELLDKYIRCQEILTFDVEPLS